MDPNEALRQIRLLIKQLRVEDKTPLRESADLLNFVQHARDLAETVEGLDEWLTKGGFLPGAWTSDRCTVQHGDWTGPHARISSCPEPDSDVIPYDLRLSFTPEAIREHFEGDDPDPTEGMSDEELAEVGRSALSDDILYREFHRALVAALEEN